MNAEHIELNSQFFAHLHHFVRDLLRSSSEDDMLTKIQIKINCWPQQSPSNVQIFLKTTQDLVEKLLVKRLAAAISH